MTKYTIDFKLEVIDHYLTGHSYHNTANSFGIKRSIVQNWVRLYQTHGVDGIRIRKSKASYSPEFKHTAVLQLLAGKSIRTLAIELNISNPSVLFQWLKAYQTHGIMGLYPKPKGRKSVPKTSKAKQTSKPDEQKTQAELIAELQHLRMENDILKKLEALERQQRKSKSSSIKSQ
ncbi:helix-turn-helix domain-containing protein [Moraxella sp. FZLJ2107]|uniref:helix-turn-helix domain-containing protein n=1 Tax=unclassified Moraxella TaxID=2685852 RepID=UPI0020C876D4|nr:MULTISPECIES: helix-turn-helix domain-containing protein [unclassified Moraxella]UTO04866.1 helix-turn-helix domain-containing protein [Moraxella sp. FZLJ2107]UTO05514.1 helix-turn-helix domain-containing protein [Moraxella sp. FZLJ2107]UTO21600.1 helix-turn-helix domain-containing protein [Moraxella sp. FZLJ2109]UTO22250.1 helix-turn-helix domain-containing protein [Moraxella sp. FZLJ2109]